MQELVDMLRVMAGACRSAANDNPVGLAQAAQYADRGNQPGIRVGLPHGMMARISIEKQNNVDNAEASVWNTMWVDPEHE